VIQVFGRSERGGGHRQSEDAFVTRLISSAPENYVCVVADGQGGQAGGAEAARVACEVCIECALAYSQNQLLSPSTWDAILRAVDQAVCDAPIAGYTTLIAFSVTETYLCGASSGDSAAILFHAIEPAISLTEWQEKNPPVGSGAAIFVPFGAKLLCPWTVLAMSDGVWKYAGWENVLTIAIKMKGEELIDALRESARVQGTDRLQDDFTVVALHG
jgi:hypothetical protein